MKNQLLTLKETARLLRCSRSHLFHLRNGKFADLPPLPVVPFGQRGLRVRSESLAEWLAHRERQHRQTLYASGQRAAWRDEDDPEFFGGA